MPLLAIIAGVLLSISPKLAGGFIFGVGIFMLLAKRYR